jgi:hypothetical protein
MRWPFVWRLQFDRVVAELQAEQKRARRRAVRAPRRTVPAIQLPPAALTIEPEMVGQPPIGEMTERVLDAIETRAGSLSSRAARQMLNAAGKAMATGESEDAVIAWIWRGDPE